MAAAANPRAPHRRHEPDCRHETRAGRSPRSPATARIRAQQPLLREEPMRRAPIGSQHGSANSFQNADLRVNARFAPRIFNSATVSRLRST